MSLHQTDLISFRVSQGQSKIVLVHFEDYLVYVRLGTIGWICLNIPSDGTAQLSTKVLVQVENYLVYVWLGTIGWIYLDTPSDGTARLHGSSALVFLCPSIPVLHNVCPNLSFHQDTAG